MTLVPCGKPQICFTFVVTRRNRINFIKDRNALSVRKIGQLFPIGNILIPLDYKVIFVQPLHRLSNTAEMLIILCHMK